MEASGDSIGDNHARGPQLGGERLQTMTGLPPDPLQAAGWVLRLSDALAKYFVPNEPPTGLIAQLVRAFGQ